MLSYLSIENIAVIEKVEITFENGFSAELFCQVIDFLVGGDVIELYV